MPVPSTSEALLRFAVVGGGISGLTAAYRLSQLAPRCSVELFEASERLGGVLSTRRENEYLIEQGADSFLIKFPWAVELCEELGLGDQLLPTNPVGRRALVVRDGRLHSVPEGFVILQPHRVLPMLLTRLLSWGGKFRLLAERWIPASKEIQCADYDESVASFATRRLGREAFERLVQPLLAGIYTADPEQLSLAATMPDAIVAERDYGSLTRAILHKARQASSEGDGSDSRASGARYASFVTPREGLGQLIEALAQRLPPAGIHLGKPISRVSRTSDQKWMVYLENNEPCGPYDGVVVAVPAPLAAVLVDEVDPQLGELLSNISYASSAVVCLVYRHDQIARQLDGFGLVMPSVEQKNIVAASFSSVKYPGRAPDDQVLVRVFLGGALQPEKVDLTDEMLQQLAEDELGELIGIRGAPLRVDVVRWREKMPQYHVGHVQLVEAIEQRVAQLDGLELAGNAYRGVGIPQCIHSGDNAARRLLAHFPPGPE